MSQKKRGACTLHKTRETSHTNITFPTRHRVCNTKCYDPKKSKGCLCQM